MNIIPLVNKFYVNQVTLTEEFLYQKSFQSSELNMCMLRRLRSFQGVTVGSVCQLTAKLQAVRVEDLKKNLQPDRPLATQIQLGPSSRISFKPPTLTARNFATTHNTSLERNQPP